MVWFSLRQHEQWGDVRYYLEGVEKEAVGERALVEYPDATVIPLRVIGWLTEGLDSFTLGVIAFCLLLDATLSVWLALRCSGGDNRRGAWWGFSFWILFGMLIGPVMIARCPRGGSGSVDREEPPDRRRIPGGWPPRQNSGRWRWPRGWWVRGATVAPGPASPGGPVPSSFWPC